jgi:hypothetical protein
MSFAETWAPALLEELGVAPDDPEYSDKLVAAEKSIAFVLAVIERYLDRRLEYMAADVETFGPGPRKRLLVRRYPLEAVAEILVGSTAVPLECFTADDEAGVIYLYGWAGWPAKVTYAGGYKDDAWPPDLFMVVMELAASCYPGILTAGVPVLAGLEPPVKRISHPDVGTIEYADNGGSSSISVLGFGIIPQAYGAVLDRFRAASIVGGA